MRNLITLFPSGFYSKKHKRWVPAVNPKKDISIEDYFDKIKKGFWQDDVLNYRVYISKHGKETDKAKEIKLKLNGVTPSGTFKYRKRTALKEHSGIIVLDADEQDQTVPVDVNQLKLKLASDKYILAVHSSCSGDGGLAIYVKINADKHEESFLSLERYFANEYNLILDQSGKDVSRYRFVSYDPDLYYNPKSKIWRKYLKKKEVEPRKHNFVFSNDDLEHVFQQISDIGLDLTYEYHNWYKIGCALADHYGASGLDYFHHVSQQSSKYDAKACDDLFKIILKRNPTKKVTIGTFLWMAKNNGIEIKTDRTKKIERVARMRMKQVGKNGGYKNKDEAQLSAKEFLTTIEGIEGNDVDEVIEKVSELPQKEIDKESSEDNIIEDLEEFLNTKNLRYNVVINNYELDGDVMTDRLYNTLYIEAKKKVSQKITKDLLISMIDSENTKEYHPFRDFFNRYRNLNPNGRIKELIECFEYKQTGFWEGEEVESEGYLELFLTKWLVSLIASMHGTYSLLILVLTGGQRTGKSKFFRNLLPKELMGYYAESKLDDGKDSEILMTQKILIVDDEFSGKSKSDAKRLKDLSSKEWFNVRKPYGRFTEDLKRYAVLAGTSNDAEIINDPTGNRRIIPVNILNIDHEKMEKIDKVELFVELYHKWQEIGDGWMLTQDEIQFLNRSTEKNEQPSAEEEMIQKYFKPTKYEGGGAEYLTNTDIKVYIEKRNPSLRISPYKLGVTLKKLGYNKERKYIKGSTKTVYLIEINEEYIQID